MSTTTENGDKALLSTGNSCLDFFVRITRNSTLPDYIDAFNKAWSENPETAIKVLMNMRDVRKGKGEKLIPNAILAYIKLTCPFNLYYAIIQKMIQYGYWKDLLQIMEIEARYYTVNKQSRSPFTNSIEVTIIAEQLKADYKLFLDSEGSDKKVPISLCAKWAPSEKTHYSHHPMYITGKIIAELNITAKEYRIMLTKLRNHLCILETLMCGQRYDEIDFSKLSSVAAMKMKAAFMRTTNAAGIETDNRKKLSLSYKDYLSKLSKGETKVNVNGIHPHEIVGYYLDSDNDVDDFTEAQWTSLVKKVTESGVFRNVTAIVDVSDSMQGQPMQVAIALGLLVSVCTTGPFYGKAITFHTTPTWHQVTGTTLKEQVVSMKSAPWGGSTNMRAVFDLILENAVSAKLTQDEMVKTLFIFTDMQFNSCDTNFESSIEYGKRTYAEAGYILPHIVCWNLRTSSSNSLPCGKNEESFAMLSGFSAELLKCVLTGNDFTPYNMMMHVLEPYVAPAEVHKLLTQLTNPLVQLNSQQLVNFETAVTKSIIKKAFKPVNVDGTVSVDGSVSVDGTVSADGTVVYGTVVDGTNNTYSINSDIVIESHIPAGDNSCQTL